MIAEDMTSDYMTAEDWTSEAMTPEEFDDVMQGGINFDFEELERLHRPFLGGPLDASR